MAKGTLSDLIDWLDPCELGNGWELWRIAGKSDPRESILPPVDDVNNDSKT